MKQILLLLISLMTTSLSLIAQYKFDEIIFDPRRMAIYDVAVYDENHSVAVGKYGIIQLISDTAKKSQYILLDEKKDLNCIIYITKNELITIGNEGVIYTSNDGGITWTLRESTTSADLTSVFMTDTTVGFAIGINGTILKTTDKGHSWISMKSNTVEDLKAISYSTSKIIFAVGKKGTMIKSTDAGINWTKVVVPTTANLNHVKAIGNKKIYVMGDSLRVLISNDGGTKWLTPVIEPKPESHFYYPRIPSYYFEDENYGIIKVYYPYYGEDYDYITTNGGLTWKREDKNSYYIEFPNEPICFDLANEDFGIMYDNRAVMYRINYKKKRINEFYISSNKGAKCIFVANFQDQYAALFKYWSGEGIHDLITSNTDLKVWNKATKFDTIGISKGYMAIEGMAMPSRNVIILAANSARDTSWQSGGTSYYMSIYTGFILKSEDLGTTWRKIKVPNNEAVYSLSMSGDKYGLIQIGKTKNKYLVTRDAAETWEYFQLPDTTTNRSIWNVDCPSPYTHELIVDDYKYGTSIYKVYEEGKMWKKGIKLPATSRIAKYVDETVIFSFGSAGNDLAKSYLYIDKTIDEGVTWTSVLVDSSQRDNSVYAFVYKDARQFMIITGSNFYITNNGGNTWDKVPLNVLNFRSDEMINCAVYYNSNEMLCGTYQGRLFRFTIDKLLFAEIEPDAIVTTPPFPNPTNDITNITIDATFVDGYYEVIDINGNICQKGKIKSNPLMSIDLQLYTEGVYFIKLIKGDKIKIEKIIKR